MRLVVTPEAMGELDRATIEAGTSETELIERAGTAVAWQARRLLGGTYGRRVVVACGKGNNGADGRVAARVLRGWGVMNPVALKTAQKTGFPADHIIGNVWSNSEEDVIPASDAAKGYVAITTQASGAQYPVGFQNPRRYPC